MSVLQALDLRRRSASSVPPLAAGKPAAVEVAAVQLGHPAGAPRERFSKQDGNQPGDPVRAAEIIVDAVHAGNLPLRLPLGRAAVDRIRERLQQRLADLDAVADLAITADYPL